MCLRSPLVVELVLVPASHSLCMSELEILQPSIRSVLHKSLVDRKLMSCLVWNGWLYSR